MLRLLSVMGMLGLFACTEKQRQLPKAVDDAGVSILQSGDPEVKRNPKEVLQAFEKLDWSIGLSRPLALLDYKPDPSHPAFCQDGRALLTELQKRVDPASKCKADLAPAPNDELDLQCDIVIEGECPYLYRATLWTELDRAVPHRYRLLGTAWLQETVCANVDHGKRAEPDPNFLVHIQIGKSFRALIDQCRQSGTQK